MIKRLHLHFPFRALWPTCLLVLSLFVVLPAHAQLLTGGNSAVGLWPSLQVDNEADQVEDPGPFFLHRMARIISLETGGAHSLGC